MAARSTQAGSRQVASRQVASLAADLVRAGLIASILALFVQTFLVQPYAVVSESMVPTLLPGDHLLVNRFVFAGYSLDAEPTLGDTERHATASWWPMRAVARGDLVLFRGALGRGRFVKRCVARGGDRVAVRADRTVLDGVEVPGEEAWIHRSGVVPRVDCPADAPTRHLLADDLFCLGDHRDRSVDSRHVGPIDRRRVVGEPFLIYWSTAASSRDDPSYDDGPRWARMFDETMNRLARTRWDRVLHTVQPDLQPDGATQRRRGNAS